MKLNDKKVALAVTAFAAVLIIVAVLVVVLIDRTPQTNNIVSSIVSFPLSSPVSQPVSAPVSAPAVSTTRTYTNKDFPGFEFTYDKSLWSLSEQYLTTDGRHYKVDLDHKATGQKLVVVLLPWYPDGSFTYCFSRANGVKISDKYYRGRFNNTEGFKYISRDVRYIYSAFTDNSGLKKNCSTEFASAMAVPILVNSGAYYYNPDGTQSKELIEVGTFDIYTPSTHAGFLAEADKLVATLKYLPGKFSKNF
jgi:hypothetical protein